MKYRFVADYLSSAGQYIAGQVVEMPDALAAWFNLDSPGILAPVDLAAELEKDRAPVAPDHDRMARGAKRRKA